MVLRVDMTSLPPTVELTQPDNFTSFKVLVVGDHAFVTRDTLVELAGDAGQDPSWLAQLDAMLEYAGRSGWTDADGAVRAHIEHADA